MSAASWQELTWILGALFVLACALLIVAIGCADSYRVQIERERALAATRLAEVRRQAAFTPCADTGPHDRVCHLPYGHPGEHWSFTGRLLATEWTPQPTTQAPGLRSTP